MVTRVPRESHLAKILAARLLLPLQKIDHYQGGLNPQVLKVLIRQRVHPEQRKERVTTEIEQMQISRN
jgi:hypothetical protein